MFFLNPTPTILLAAANRAVAEGSKCNADDKSSAEIEFAKIVRAVAIREIEASGDIEKSIAKDISNFYGENKGAGMQKPSANFYEYWRRLAEDIRAGYFDAGPKSSAVHALLSLAADRCLQMENPSYFSVPKY